MTDIGVMTFPWNQHDVEPFERRALYVFVSRPFVKFGIARDPLRRFQDIRAANPHPIRVAAAWWLPLAVIHRAEAYVHDLCGAHFHRNEWFRMDPSAARAAAKQVAIAAAASRKTEPLSVKLPLAQDLERQLRLRNRTPSSGRVLRGVAPRQVPPPANDQSATDLERLEILEILPTF